MMSEQGREDVPISDEVKSALPRSRCLYAMKASLKAFSTAMVSQCRSYSRGKR